MTNDEIRRAQAAFARQMSTFGPESLLPDWKGRQMPLTPYGEALAQAATEAQSEAKAYSERGLLEAIYILYRRDDLMKGEWFARVPELWDESLIGGQPFPVRYYGPVETKPDPTLVDRLYRALDTIANHGPCTTASAKLVAYDALKIIAREAIGQHQPDPEAA